MTTQQEILVAALLLPLLCGCSLQLQDCSDFNALSQSQLENGAHQKITVCHFDDNRQCTLNALRDGHCPRPRKVTGYLSEQARYCAISGGEFKQVSGGEDLCTPANGTAISARVFYSQKH